MSTKVIDLLGGLSRIGTQVELNDVGGLRLTGQEPPPDVIVELQAAKVYVVELLRLDERLNIGWDRCEPASDPATCSEYDTHWIALLREYEHLVDGGAS